MGKYIIIKAINRYIEWFKEFVEWINVKGYIST